MKEPLKITLLLIGLILSVAMVIYGPAPPPPKPYTVIGKIIYTDQFDNQSAKYYYKDGHGFVDSFYSKYNKFNIGDTISTLPE